MRETVRFLSVVCEENWENQ